MIDFSRLPQTMQRAVNAGKQTSLVTSSVMKKILQMASSNPGAEAAWNVYIDSFKEFYEAFEKMPRGRDAIKIAHESFDEMQAHSVARDKAQFEIACRKGCSACCRIYVSASPSEIDQIAEYSRSNGITVDRERAKKQLPAKTEAEYMSMDWETRACVFLDTDSGECKVYPVRPLNCRKYLVSSDPAICDPRNKLGKDPYVYVEPNLEAFTTAFEYVDGGPKAMERQASLPRQLLEKFPQRHSIWRKHH